MNTSNLKEHATSIFRVKMSRILSYSLLVSQQIGTLQRSTRGGKEKGPDLGQHTGNVRIQGGTCKANSHMPCHTHAVPLPFFDSAGSFIKVRTVAGNI
jgi:hypothetical protein